MSDQNPKFWNNAQTYGMAIMCMLLGVAAGYLLRAPAEASPTPSMSGVSAPATPAAPAPQMPSAADMKRTAGKQVAPLLADLEKHPNDADLLAKYRSRLHGGTAVSKRSRVLREIRGPKAQGRYSE